MELTIRNEESKKSPEFNWQKLDESSHLASIMRTSMDQFCDFRLPGTDKCITRWKKVSLIDWSKFQGEYLPKDSTRPSTEIWSAKVTMRTLYECYLKTNRQSWFDHGYEIAINADLVEYYTKMQPIWADELQSKCGENPNGLISDSWITNMKTYKVNEQVDIYDNYNEN